MSRPVYLVTGGMSKFDRAIPDKKTEELCVDALTEAAQFIGMTPHALKKHIHSCYYGHFADHFGDQLLGEAVIHDRLGLDPLGNIGIKTGGATGGSTLWEAYKTIASGYSDCVLAMGWERMDEVPTDEGNNYISCTTRSRSAIYRPMKTSASDLTARAEPMLNPATAITPIPGPANRANYRLTFPAD